MRARSVLIRGSLLVVAGLPAAIGSSADVAHAASSIRLTDTSPMTGVVARAPLAVSVTFDRAPDPAGASMRIYGPDGEVSAAQAEVVGTALRRALDPSVPGGNFTVTWSARTLDGTELTGSFSFTAARGTGIYANEPARPTVRPSGPLDSASEPPVSVVQPSGSAPGPAASAPSASEPSVAASAPSIPVSEQSGRVSPPSAPAPSAVSAPAGGGQPPSASDTRAGSLAAPLKIVPLGLVALLVIASAGVGLISARRRSSGGAAGAGAAATSVVVRP